MEEPRCRPAPTTAGCSEHLGAHKPNGPSGVKATTFIYHLGKTGQGGFHRESQDQGSKKKKKPSTCS